MNRRMWTVVVAAVLLVSVVLVQNIPGVSAGEPTVEVLTERPIEEVVGADYAPLATLSPDGAHIAWAMLKGKLRNKEQQICVYTFHNADKVCHTLPGQINYYPYVLVWSPDSTRVAFTEDAVATGTESDLWVLNVVDGALSNLTDDGVEGNWRTMEYGSFDLDYLPMWGPDGSLYFWRTQPEDLFEGTLALYRIPAGGGDAELVRDLTDDFGKQFPLYDSESWYMDGISAISPDGSKVSVALRAPDGAVDTAKTGVWLIDLGDDAADPIQIATREDLQSALPEWKMYPGNPMGLSWTAESSGLVIVVYSYDVHFPFTVFYYVDMADGEMTPVVDFSQTENPDALFTTIDEATGLPLRYFSPWTGSLSPANKTLLMYNNLGGIAGMLEAPLPPDGSYPTPIHESPQVSYSITTRTSRGGDDKVIMMGILFDVEEK